MRFNQILNGRWSPQVVRLFGLKVIESPVPTLAPEIAPSFDVNDRHDATISLLRQEKLIGGVAIVNAVAGQNGQVRLRNPVNSGVLVEIERIAATNSVTSVAGWLATTSDLTPTAAYVKDTRWQTLNGTGTSAAILSTTTTAVLPSINRVAVLPSGINDQMLLPFVLTPGFALDFHVLTVNTGLSLGIEWRERAYPPEEQQTG